MTLRPRDFSEMVVHGQFNHGYIAASFGSECGLEVVARVPPRIAPLRAWGRAWHREGRKAERADAGACGPWTQSDRKSVGFRTRP